MCQNACTPAPKQVTVCTLSRAFNSRVEANAVLNPVKVEALSSARGFPRSSSNVREPFGDVEGGVTFCGGWDSFDVFEERYMLLLLFLVGDPRGEDGSANEILLTPGDVEIDGLADDLYGLEDRGDCEL